MKVLLALSTTRHSEKAIQTAIKRAAEMKATLIVVFILDEEVPGNLFQQLTDRGFLGEKPSDELAEAIKGEYELRAREETETIQRLAEQRGVPCETSIVWGNFADECLLAVMKTNASLVILTRRKRSRLARLLLGSAVDSLKSQCHCPVEIIDD